VRNEREHEGGKGKSEFKLPSVQKLLFSLLMQAFSSFRSPSSLKTENDADNDTELAPSFLLLPKLVYALLMYRLRRCRPCLLPRRNVEVLQNENKEGKGRNDQ
jgi:hypothetical protein